MTDVSEAIQVAKRALPNASAALIALVVAIGGLESHWGDGWPGTNNWGAITAGSSWTGQVFEHQDSKWTPSGVQTYVTNFRRYDSPEAGAADLGALLESHYAKAVQAATDGNWPNVSKYLYEGGYYTGTTPKPQAIAAHYKRLRDFLVEQGISAPLLVAGAIGLEWLLWGALAFLIFKRKRIAHG